MTSKAMTLAPAALRLSTSFATLSRGRGCRGPGVDRLAVSNPTTTTCRRPARPGTARRWHAAGSPRRPRRIEPDRGQTGHHERQHRDRDDPADQQPTIQRSDLRSRDRPCDRRSWHEITREASRAGDNARDAPLLALELTTARPGDRGRAVGGAARPDHRGAVAAGARGAPARQGRRGQAAPPPQPRRADRRDAAGGSVPADDTTTTTSAATSATRRPRSAGPHRRTEPPTAVRRSTRGGQVTAKNIRASQVVSPSTDARACAQPPRALSRSTSTTRSSSSPGRTTRRNRTFSTPPNSASFPA